MQTKDYLKYITDEIHTVVVATIDKKGFPFTAAIDMMDADDGGLYFLTAKGKGFYDRLKCKKVLAFTGIKGEDTTPYVIEQTHCLHCGNCLSVCPVGAVERRKFYE